MDAELKWKIFYYGREEYYEITHNFAKDGIKKYPEDLSFKILSGYSLVLGGRYQEGIRELESLMQMKDVNIGAILALISAHRLCKTVDREAVLMLDEKLKAERKSASYLALYYASFFLFLQQKTDKAREYLDKGLKQNNEFTEGICLKGWIELFGDRGGKFKNATTCFKTVLEKDKRNLDALLGLVKIKELEKNSSDALAQLNQVIVKVPNALPPLIEKMKIQLGSSDWDQVLETASRILNLDGSCIEAQKLKALVLVCRDGHFEEAAISLRRLQGEIDKVEPKNAKLSYEISQLFASFCTRNASVLRETQRLAEKAAQIAPGNADYMVELGYQSLYLGKVKEAVRFFKNATKIDDSSITGLIGITLCQMIDSGVNEQVKQQVEFLQEVQKGEPSSELLLMSARLCISPEEVVFILKEAINLKIALANQFLFGTKFLISLNIDLLMELVKESTKWSSKATPETSAVLLENCLPALNEIIRAAPGLLDPNLELARIHFLLGNFKASKDVLSHILDDLDASLPDAHVLLARINLNEKNYLSASRSLEVALSYNFQVREHPLYHLVSAKVAAEQGNTAEVIKFLKDAMASPAFQDGVSSSGLAELSASDKVTIYLELVRSYSLSHRQQEADDLMKKAMSQFKDTPEEGRIFVANAELLVERGHVNAALDALLKIQPGENYYPLARRALADIHLKHRRNREAYAQCYVELVSVAPSRETYEMLGDAYTAIQETDAAIEAYEEALKIDGKDGRLICKMGKALVKTHHFTKAVNYYKDAVKNDENPELVYDMAELYFKLGQLDNAERVLNKHVNDLKIDTADIPKLTARTKLLQLLAKVRDKSGNLTDSLAALKSAKENHSKMDKRLLLQSDEHKNLIVQICVDTALLLNRLRDFGGAIKSFKEALTFRPNDPKVLVSLARLHLQTNNMEECQTTCQHLLSSDPGSEPATVMLADIAFSNVDFETAAHHFKQLLSRKPDYWTALARLIEVMRRTGKLDEVKPFLDKAESHSYSANQDAGLHFCKGLHAWYNGEAQNALTFFNRARADNVWGQKAIYNMIDVCLNFDYNSLGGEANANEMDDNEIPDAQENALKTANRLLMELKPKKNTDEAFTHRLLENFWLLATRQKGNVERALNDLVQIANDDFSKDSVGVGLGIATAFMLQKQTQKARNHLKRMVKTQWRYEEAEYLERSWLPLADIYINSGKSDLAADLIQRVLQHNNSCSRAYEYAGYIAEKEQLYKEAAFQYDNAWKYNGKCNPVIGYKLAYNYMKGKSYADAIDICHAVLKINPGYPRIHKEILEKSRNNLRT